jgi:hypothetical protein
MMSGAESYWVHLLAWVLLRYISYTMHIVHFLER